MQLEDYFNFLAPNDIRLKGSRIGIETILYEYIERKCSPEEIAQTYTTLTLEQVYATILYYLQNQEAVSQYMADWRFVGTQSLGRTTTQSAAGRAKTDAPQGGKRSNKELVLDLEILIWCPKRYGAATGGLPLQINSNAQFPIPSRAFVGPNAQCPILSRGGVVGVARPPGRRGPMPHAQKSSQL